MTHDELTKLSSQSDLHSEEDVKVKVVIPYLQSLGYDKSNMRFENSIEVTVGSKTTNVSSDIEILVDGAPQIIVDTKNPRQTLRHKDVLQAVSYAEHQSPHPRVSSPPMPSTSVMIPAKRSTGKSRRTIYPPSLRCGTPGPTRCAMQEKAPPHGWITPPSPARELMLGTSLTRQCNKMTR